jgi:hypothetical protein
MDLIHFRTLFPRFLPTDIIDSIYYLLGQRTPTCNIMSKYILSISSHFKKMREYSNNSSPTSYFRKSNDNYDFNTSTDTLWNATFWWHLPKFLTRTAELNNLTRVEVDLTIAYHQLQQTLCGAKIEKSTDPYAIETMREWHKGHILDLQDNLSERAKTECLEIDRFERGTTPP